MEIRKRNLFPRTQGTEAAVASNLRQEMLDFYETQHRGMLISAETLIVEFSRPGVPGVSAIIRKSLRGLNNKTRSLRKRACTMYNHRSPALTDAFVLAVSEPG